MAAGVSLLRSCVIGAALSTFACGEAPSPPAATPAATPAAQSAISGQSRPTNTENACELLTRADAEAVLGSPVEDLADESAPTPMGDKVLTGRCYYEGDGGSVSLSVSKHVDSSYAAERFAKLRGRHDTDPSFRPLPGLGEDAFAEHESLHVKRGDLLLRIELKRSGERKLKHYSDKPGLDALAADERKIAEEALKRLPAVTKP